MLRFLQVVENKPIKIVKASEDMTRGAVVADSFSGTVSKASGVGSYLVDVAKNYDGINSIIEPTDGAFETIASGATVLRVPTLLGERYATTELTIGTLVVGNPIVASSGKFVKAGVSTEYEWVYGGTYADPSVTAPMYIIEKVAHGVTAAS